VGDLCIFTQKLCTTLLTAFPDHFEGWGNGQENDRFPYRQRQLIWAGREEGGLVAKKDGPSRTQCGPAGGPWTRPMRSRTGEQGGSVCRGWRAATPSRRKVIGMQKTEPACLLDISKGRYNKPGTTLMSTLPNTVALEHPTEASAQEEDLRQGLATLRLENLSVGGDALSIFERYACGEITLAELGDQIDQFHEQRYGRSLPVSGDDGSSES